MSQQDDGRQGFGPSGDAAPGRCRDERSRSARHLAVAAAVVVATLLSLPSLASADYEQLPQHFGEAQEEVTYAKLTQLKGALSVAVNFAGTQGAGGVEPGSVYVGIERDRVLRFSAGAEGEAPRFEEAWGWGVGDGKGEFERCGPAYAQEPRPQGTFPACQLTQSWGGGFPGEQPGHFGEVEGLAVDQATGDVYVHNQSSTGFKERHIVEVFSPRGTPIGEGFGEVGRNLPTPSESIAEGPEKLHEQTYGHAIAVDAAGTVYLTDTDFGTISGPRQNRVMAFEPAQPGDFTHYVYAGEGRDTTNTTEYFRAIALVGTTRLVAASQTFISEYPAGGGSTPICTYSVSGQLKTMTANPTTGEVFYFVGPAHALHRLGPCNETTKKFEEAQGPLEPTPLTNELDGLAVNPSLSWGPLRPAGVVYGVANQILSDTFTGLGYVFAQARNEGLPPEIVTESVAHTTSTSSTLQAQINPRGSSTNYRFQYLPQAQYEANEPDERQSLTVSATGGLFGLGFDGGSLGGVAAANLTSGSKTASALITANGTATLHAAKGTANLTGAVGEGTVIEGATTIVGASTTEGEFAQGETISGKGIPAGTTISAVSGSELTISAPATESTVNTALAAGTTTLTSVSTEEGAFEPGMSVEGQGIPSGTTIEAVSGSELTLSQPVTAPGTAAEIKAGSTTLATLSVSEGTFAVGQRISGEGIPAGTTITATRSGSLQISSVPTKSGNAVAISASGPAPLAVGEAIEGAGIPAGTTIAAIEAGALTLSQPASATIAKAHLRAGLPFDATSTEVRKALEGLATIGKGNVEVSGGPGDETGSHAYVVSFIGALSNQDLPELSAEGAGLTGGQASVAVSTVHEGGGGFAHGAVEAPISAAALAGSGAAAAPVPGLDPDTAYRFRVIADNECDGSGNSPCVGFGAPASFHTYPLAAAGLPDQRAYELVSPAQKNGGEAFPADPSTSSCLAECKPPGLTGIYSVFPMESTADGDAVSYMGFAFSPREGAATFNSYISRRTAAGWQTTAMSPRRLPNASFLAYDESLGEGAITAAEPQLAESAPVGYPNLYLQTAEDSAAVQPVLTKELFEALQHSPHPRPYREGHEFQIEYEGHSPDFAAQYFSANDSLTAAAAYAPEPEDPGQGGRDLYESRAGNLALVNVLPGNDAVAPDASFASTSPDTHAVSTGGDRVFWEAGGHLYVREDNRTTREVHHAGAFLAASPDGLEVLLSDGCLYSLTTAKCGADLTEGQGGFLGMAGQSEDFAKIYFVDSAALPGENERGEEGEAGEPNLYLHEAGKGARFIATLAPSDNNGANAEELSDWASAPGERTAEASPDGRYLAFGSSMQLTGHGNIGPCQKSQEGGREFFFKDAPCHEVFLYDSETGKLTCPSCSTTGEAPPGNSTLRRIFSVKAKGWLPQPRYLTDQGRLFFDSSDRLSPNDTNGRVEDVYEAEPEGIGSCARAAGCVSLISSGTGSVDSNFLAMDESGNNVFFTTRERLAKQDTDELIDVYDARVDGGFPGDAEAAPAECRGEACQATATSSSPEPLSGSLAFSGAGNVLAPALPPPVTKPKPLTKAEELAKALKTCKRKPKKQRPSCEKTARQKYGTSTKAKKSKSRTSNHKRGGAK
jgi:hypothetical protein